MTWPVVGAHGHLLGTWSVVGGTPPHESSEGPDAAFLWYWKMQEIYITPQIFIINLFMHNKPVHEAIVHVECTEMMICLTDLFGEFQKACWKCRAIASEIILWS